MDMDINIYIYVSYSWQNGWTGKQKKIFFFQNPIFLLLFGSLEVVKNINVNILVLLMQV